MTKKKKTKHGLEDSQRHQLVLYYKQELRPIYPNLGMIVVPNRGYKSVVAETSHPDCLWRLFFGGHYHWLFQELKTLTGSLDVGQREWWEAFEETEYVEGIVTKGLAEDYKGVDLWLSSFYPDHKFKKI